MNSTSQKITLRPSPNYGPRRGGILPELIVLHYTAMESAEAALERLCDPEFEVSSHYLICEQGHVFQLVKEDMRAWHAGAGSWGGRDDVNSRSIGIELSNRGDHPFSEAQMAAVEALLADIMSRWDIEPAGVIGHSDMAPGRKHDPGPKFDWARLAKRKLSVWPDLAGEGDFWQDAARFGYPVDNVNPDDLLIAFRSRFRPEVSGPLDEQDVALMACLAKHWPAVETA